MNPENGQQLPLRDVHLPAEPGFWPLAPGWWILAALLLVVIVALGVWWYRYRQRKKNWQQMRNLLFAIHKNHQSHGDDVRLARDLSNLLRRFTRHQLNNTVAATLSGQQWIDFLNRDLAEPLFDGLTAALNTAQYQPTAHYQSEALFQAVHQFLQYHCLKNKRGLHD